LALGTTGGHILCDGAPGQGGAAPVRADCLMSRFLRGSLSSAYGAKLGGPSVVWSVWAQATLPTRSGCWVASRTWAKWRYGHDAEW